MTMRARRPARRVVALILFAAAVLIGSPAARACGGLGQRACGYTSATKHGKAFCPHGTFLDIGRGECWSCPAGYNRTVFPVTAGNACELPARSEPARATYHKHIGCPGGSFFDPRNGGECWSCPRGYNRTLAPVTAGNACAKGLFGRTAHATYRGRYACSAGEFLDPRRGGECWSCPSGYRRSIAPVTAADACLRTIGARWTRATYHKKIGCGSGSFLDIGRGECWSCPSRYNRTIFPVTGARACLAAAGCAPGLIQVGNRCERRGRCGRNGERPCLVIERIPSCNAGLREDFHAHRCVPLRPGETPFTAGLASLSGEVARGTAICEHVLEALPQLSTGIKAVDVDLACTRDMQVGFVCAVARSAEKIRDTAALFQKFNREYHRSPCRDQLKWYNARATRHGRSHGLNCPGGQFFDLIDGGSCWSCPRGYVRSLEPVTSPAACARATGTPAVFRSACAGVMAVTRDAGKQVHCLEAMVRSGVLLQAFRGRRKEMCTFAGEEAYFATLDFLTGTSSPRTRLEHLMEKLRKINESLNKAGSANDFLNKVESLRECRGVFDHKGKPNRRNNDRGRSNKGGEIFFQVE